MNINRFKSDQYSTNGPGFQMTYSSLNCDEDENCMPGKKPKWSLWNDVTFIIICCFSTDCGGNYSDAIGQITSPSYPNPYPLNADCVFIISQPSGAYINVTFISMDINCNISICYCINHINSIYSNICYKPYVLIQIQFCFKIRTCD